VLLNCGRVRVKISWPEKKGSIMKIQNLKSVELSFLALACLVVLPLFGCAGRDDGLVAYKRGDFTGALKEYRAENGPSADFALGVMYYKGEGVERDRVTAAAFFRKAAEQGHVGAQYNLALMYNRGVAVPRDTREAARLYTLAAEQGFDKAQYNLGLMYACGAKSARQGNMRALKQLQEMVGKKGVNVAATEKNR